MSHPTASIRRHRPARTAVAGGTGLGLAFIALLAGTGAAQGQMTDRWVTTADRYDEAAITAHLSEVAAVLAARHGPLAEEIFAMNAQLMRVPNALDPRSAGPAVPPIGYRIEASHLVHYQASSGGSLGRLHGSSAHPAGVGWLPHSMFAQSGGVYGRWGHARLLGAIRSYQERHAD